MGKGLPNLPFHTPSNDALKGYVCLFKYGAPVIDQKGPPMHGVVKIWINWLEKKYILTKSRALKKKKRQKAN